MKQETYKTWKIGLYVSFGLLAIFLIYVALNPPAWIFEHSNEHSNKAAMERVCDVIGGEPYIYKVGWSDTCGFDVYRGTCVKFGEVLDPEGYLLVNGNKFSFDEIEGDFPSKELGTLEDKRMQGYDDYDKEYKKILDEFEKNACNKLNQNK